MKKFISVLLVGSQLTTVVPAYAEPPAPQPIVLPDPPQPAPGEPDVGAAISPMKKGKIAPFTGILLSPKATATIIAQLNFLQEQIRIEVDHARAEEQARCDFRVSETTTHLNADKAVLQAQVDERGKRINVLTDQLKKEEAQRSSATFLAGAGAVGGLIVGIGLSALTVYAVGKASK